MGSNNCQNGAQCFYGTQCRFSTQQFGLSLDAILGYQIRSNLSISRQSIYAKIIEAMSESWLWHISACIIADIGPDYYLFKFQIMVSYPFANVDSYVAIFSRIQLYFHRSLFAITDGFHACVALERLVTAIVDVKFNLTKSKTMAKLLIIIISLFTCVSFLHDPIHRYLIDNDEEQRTWCMVHFTPSLNLSQP
ncbi:unnamed protein product [Rotaria magnacalcarata]|uniref:Uncharacterized protein n=1 Tax=Rotaria magnacalcarata TaxID=392030 RepID=A0A8S3ASJ6_9BILA|nr:unnamed protein product [Rotaria magnacalcarata]